jgi:hypothetical protein
VSSNNEGNGDSDESGGQATEAKAMTMAMTVVGKYEGNGNGNECGGRYEEGEGGMAMVT